MLQSNLKNTLLLITLFTCFALAPKAVIAQNEMQLTEDMINMIVQQVEKEMQDAPYKDIIDIDIKCLIREMITNATALNDAVADFEAMQDKFITIYPNPAKSTDVTVEFLKDWPFKCKKPAMKSLEKTEMKLFYNDKLITNLDKFPVTNNKITIPASLLKDAGTYTISSGADDFSTSFMVTK